MGSKVIEEKKSSHKMLANRRNKVSQLRTRYSLIVLPQPSVNSTFVANCIHHDITKSRPRLQRCHLILDDEHDQSVSTLGQTDAKPMGVRFVKSASGKPQGVTIVLTVQDATRACNWRV